MDEQLTSSGTTPQPPLTAAIVRSSMIDMKAHRLASGLAAFRDLYAGNEAAQEIFSKYHEHAEALHNEIVRLRSALARVTAECEGLSLGVPKTADGVPITFGMTVFMADPDGNPWPEPAEPVSGQVTGIYASSHDYPGGVCIGFGDWEGGNLEVYSSRDAFFARHAARKEAADGA